MLENKTGQAVPFTVFHTRQGSEWQDVTTDQLFKGKTVAVFFTPWSFYTDMFIIACTPFQSIS